MTLIAIPDPLQAAQAAQEMVNKNVYTAVIGFLVVTVAAMAVWVLRSQANLAEANEKRDQTQDKRVADKDADRTRSDAMAREMTAALLAAREVFFVMGERVEDVGEKVAELSRRIDDLQASGGKKRTLLPAPPAPVSREGTK